LIREKKNSSKSGEFGPFFFHEKSFEQVKIVFFMSKFGAISPKEKKRKKHWVYYGEGEPAPTLVPSRVEKSYYHWP
jgi:hypothetical protein